MEFDFHSEICMSLGLFISFAEQCYILNSVENLRVFRGLVKIDDL